MDHGSSGWPYGHDAPDISGDHDVYGAQDTGGGNNGVNHSHQFQDFTASPNGQFHYADSAYFPNLNSFSQPTHVEGQYQGGQAQQLGMQYGEQGQGLQRNVAYASAPQQQDHFSSFHQQNRQPPSQYSAPFNAGWAEQQRSTPSPSPFYREQQQLQQQPQQIQQSHGLHQVQQHQAQQHQVQQHQVQQHQSQQHQAQQHQSQHHPVHQTQQHQLHQQPQHQQQVYGGQALGQQFHHVSTPPPAQRAAPFMPGQSLSRYQQPMAGLDHQPQGRQSPGNFAATSDFSSLQSSMQPQYTYINQAPFAGGPNPSVNRSQPVPAATSANVPNSTIGRRPSAAASASGSSTLPQIRPQQHASLSSGGNGQPSSVTQSQQPTFTVKQAPVSRAAPTGTPAQFTIRNMDTAKDMVAVPGFPFLFVGPPLDRPSALACSTPKYIATKYSRDKPMTTDPNRRLPCEIAREWNDLVKKLDDGTVPDQDQPGVLERTKSLNAEYRRMTGNSIPDAPRKSAKRVGRNGASVEITDDDTSDEEDLSEEELQKLAKINRAREIMSAPSRPADPLKAVEYDVVRIVWRDPRNTSEYSYNKALKDFGNYVFNELWAQINELKKQLDETQDKTSRGKLQSDMTGKYDLIHAAIKTALAFGDDHLLRHTGQHAKLMVALFTALRRRFASSKSTYNDSFTKTVLKFLSCITTMDNDQLNARLKFDAFRNKYYEGLDEEGRVYLNEISSNASRADSQTVRQLDTAIGVKNEKENLSKKPAVPAVKSAAPTSAAAPKTAGSKPTIPLKKTASEVKKIQPTDYSGLGSARKVSNGSSKVNASASPFKRAREDDVDSRAPKKVAVEGATGVTASSKVAPATAVSSSSQGTAAASAQSKARAAGSMLLSKSRTPAKAPTKAPAKTSTKKSEPKAPTAPSTIGGLLAEIAKPIEKQKPREEPAKASETPEEKTRRLRKEARRGLRVAWKPDRELVEYRIFEHDSAEDEGRASNMVRDARDNRSEGQMLKMKRDIQEDEEEDEEDRRDEKPKEVELQTWSPPSLANLSPLDQQQREKNYVTRAGLREVESEQKKVMEEYENRELMAIYTSFSEIPETPRSPLSRDIDGSNEAKIAYLPADNPKFQEIHRRWAEVHQFGITTATHLALQRLGISPSDAAASSLRGSPSARSSLTSHGKAPGATKSSTSHAPRMMTQAERDAEVLFLLQSGRARAYIDPSPYDPEKANAEQRQVYNDPKVQGAAEFIERISAQLKDLPFPPTEPPKWMLANPDRVKEWHTGRNNDFAAKAKRDASARAAKLAEEHARRMAENASASSTTAQTIPYGAYQPQQQQSHQISQAPTQVPDQYAAILQQVQALQGNPSAQNPPLPATPQPDQSLQNLLAALGQGQTQQPASQASQQAPDYNYWQAWAQSQAQAYGAQAYGGQGQTAPAYTEQYDGAVHDGQQAYGSQHQGYPSQQAQQSGPQRREDGEWGSRKDFSSRVNKDLKGINRALIGTKACSFWAKGQCAKGDSCTFRHDPNDLK